jgi:MacB-like periplasmic core domain/3-keto-disaccharide hydrolase
VERAATVCVLGQTVAEQLFGSQDPIGETIRVKDQPCMVVGVLEVKGQSAAGQDRDDTFLMPYTMVTKKSNQWHTLRVDFAGHQFTVIFNGQKALEWADDRLKQEGKVGVWTKAVSVTTFDDFAYRAK